jgi:hypothetical protein
MLQGQAFLKGFCAFLLYRHSTDASNPSQPPKHEIGLTSQHVIRTLILCWAAFLRGNLAWLKVSTFRVSAILRNANSNCPVSLSVSMKQQDSNWTDFYEIWYCKVLLKRVDTVQFWLKSNITALRMKVWMFGNGWSIISSAGRVS